jgi:sRNA-binding protein
MTSRFDPRAIEATLQLLSAKWPRCFFVFEQRRRPLALRIDQQIAAALGDIITSDDLNAALRFYTGNLCY